MAIGIFSQPSLLKNLVAASARFQTVVGAANESAAKSFIALYAAIEDYIQPPRAVITVQDFSHGKTGTDNWQTTGNLQLTFEFKYDLPTEDLDGVNDSYNLFEDDFETIIKEMTALAGQGEPTPGRTHLNVNSFEMANEPQLDPLSESDIEDPETNTTQKCIWWVTFNVNVF